MTKQNCGLRPERNTAPLREWLGTCRVADGKATACRSGYRQETSSA